MKNSFESKKLLRGILLLTPLVLLKPVSAHCPLCTVGAVAAAGGAAWLGISTIVIGVFLGAFATSMGWWFSKLIKKRFVPFQKALIVLFSFATTIIPMLAMFDEPMGYYLSLTGSYGTLLNRTYTYNPFLVGSLIGLLIISVTPSMSEWITKMRNGRMMRFQGMALTFGLLLIASGILELVL